jgi:hypothetical protein
MVMIGMTLRRSDAPHVTNAEYFYDNIYNNYTTESRTAGGILKEDDA